MTGPTAERRADSRRRLLAAVRSGALLGRLSARPWPGVASTLGVSRSSLVEHFPREQDLLDARGGDRAAARLEGREFAIAAPTATRALNSYERAFEPWLLQGRDEVGFPASRFATEALPDLVAAMIRPSDDSIPATVGR